MSELAQWFWTGVLWGASVFGFLTTMFFVLLTFGGMGMIIKPKKEAKDAGADGG